MRHHRLSGPAPTSSAPQWIVLAGAIALLLASPATVLRAGGGGATTTFSVADGPALTGEIVVRPVAIDHVGGGLVGWSLGVCHPADLVELLAVADGPGLLTAKNGAPPDFHLLQLLPDGFTSGVVVCFTGCALLPQGSAVIHEPSYQAIGLAPATAALDLCGTLSEPPVPLLVVLPGGATAEPDAIDGSIAITGPLPLRFRIDVGTGSVLYDPGNGIASAEVPVTLSEEAISAGAPNAITGFTIPLGHDPIFATAVSALPGADLALAGGGAGPDTFLVDLHPAGLVIAATIPLSPPWLALTPREAARVEYASVPGTLTFNYFGLDVAVAVSPAVTAPATAAAVDSPVPLPVGIVALPGMIEFTPREGFRRGDANDDALLDIGDVVSLLGYLFSGGALTCRDAGDTNDDGLVNVADPISLLGYFFSGGAAPPPPYPGCGFDAGAQLGCSFHSSCP